MTQAAPDLGNPPEDASGTAHTFCRICEAFCGLKVDVSEGRAVKIAPDRDNPHSRGHVCVKGTSFLDVVYDPDRVLQPLRRDRATDRFVPVDWDEALDEIADRLAAILREDGPDAIANYNGNPSAFSVGATLAIRPFFTHFGVWKMFAAATQDVSSRMLASYILYGSALRLPIPDLPRCDMLIALGANMLVSHGSLLTAPRLREDLDGIAARGRVVVIDPRRTETASRYEHLFVRPDSDAWLLAAMLRTLFVEDLVDEHLLRNRTQGWEGLRAAVMDITPEIAEDRCGVEAEAIVALARDFAAAPRAAVYGRTGTCRGNHSTLVNVFICALNIVTGRFAAEGGWVFGDAAIDMAATRPGGCETRETRFGPRPYIGRNLHFSQLPDEILEPGDGRVRALFMESGNIVASAPGSDRTADALRSLDLFVSVDIYRNDSNRYADFILPGTTFLEREDIPMFGFPHMIRPWAQFTGAVIAARGEAREEHHIFAALAARLHARLTADPGGSGYDKAEPQAVRPMEIADRLFEQSGTASPTRAGGFLSIDELKEHPHGIQLSEELSCATSWDKLLHPDRRIRLWDPILYAEMQRLRDAAPADAGTLLLFSRRDLKSINSWMHNSERLVRSQQPALMVHPADAQERGLADGELALISSAAATLEVIVHVSDDVVRGAVCYPHGWGHQGGWQRANAAGGVNINRLASGAAGEFVSASSLLDGIRVQLCAASQTADVRRSSAPNRS